MRVTVTSAHALAFSVLVPTFLVSHIDGDWDFLVFINNSKKGQKEIECLMFLFSLVAEYPQPLGFCDQVMGSTCGLSGVILFG